MKTETLKDIQTNEKHWYLFSFTFTNGTCQAIKGLKNQKITKTVIDEARSYAIKNKDDAILIAVSYLGYMTREELGYE